MSLKITFKHPHFDDTEFAVNGLGMFTPGKAMTIDKEGEEHFYAVHGVTVKEYFKGNDHFKVEGTSELKASEGGNS
jgi:hypothetical protein